MQFLSDVAVLCLNGPKIHRGHGLDGGPRQEPSFFTKDHRLRGLAVFPNPLSLRLLEGIPSNAGSSSLMKGCGDWLGKSGRLMKRNCAAKALAPGHLASGIWHLDEVVIPSPAESRGFWRAGDQDGCALDEIVQSRPTMEGCDCGAGLISRPPTFIAPMANNMTSPLSILLGIMTSRAAAAISAATRFHQKLGREVGVGQIERQKQAVACDVDHVARPDQWR
jgi:hypothetical protein